MASKRKNKNSSMNRSAINRRKKKNLRTIKKRKFCSNGRTRLMNEDVMIKIMPFLSVKELLRLERTSHQLKYCVNKVLKQQKGLSIGRISPKTRCFDERHSIVSGNVTNALVYRDIDSKQNQNYLKSIFEKCNRIKCLYLNESRISVKTVEMILQTCERLKCLFLGHIFLDSDSVSESTELVYYCRRQV